MGKPYLNNAVIGNGSMLGCIAETGELIRLYWPEIDFPQHLEKMLTGFFNMQQVNSTLWLSEGDHAIHQRYLEHTNILETTAIFQKLPLKVVQTDFCLPKQPVLIRHYEITNTGEADFSAGMGIGTHVISHPYDLGNTLFDFELDALVHYRHRGCWAIASDKEVHAFQIGDNPFGAIWEGKLNGRDSIGMSPDGALIWRIGDLPPGCLKNLTVFFVFSDTLAQLKDITLKLKEKTYEEYLFDTRQYWKDYVNACLLIQSGNDRVDRIYERSLLMFYLMSDRNTGGLLASPEIDEQFTQCGRYAYCWCRDAAFITRAMDEVGLHADTEKFYNWAKRVQSSEGFWHQRYHMNGNLAPSWGIQIDETGSILFGIQKHYEVVEEIGFLENMLPAVEKAMSFLETFVDQQTHLPLPSFDLWEERLGEHTYSTAAVIAGIRAACDIGRILGVPNDTLTRWNTLAETFQKAFLVELVDSKRGVFKRSIKVKLNPWGEEPSSDTAYMKVNPKGYTHQVTLSDTRMDISLLGPVVPFHILDVHDPIIRKTVSELEDRLTCSKVGGIYRYEQDHYAGGNPWVISTLWLALYYIEANEVDKARELFHWATKAGTHLDLLPEQVDKQDGKPCWVIPLTWSHAMYVLVLKRLMEKGGIEGTP